jgi:hypothetical protein
MASKTYATRRRRRPTRASRAALTVAAPAERRYCSLPVTPPRVFSRDVNPRRASLILRSDRKWVNGTVLRYFFFNRTTDGERVFFEDGTSTFVTWSGPESQKEVVRKAFQKWKSLGIGLEFKEVQARDEAEVRIGFMSGDGSWSFIGRDILTAGAGRRTMNFGWDIAVEPDTALHEIGHTLGFPHEHQNPNAGIIWDEEAVYAALAKPPNRWDRTKTFNNIISKIDPDTVQGSNWDPDSIMHYPFEAGLIREPAQYRQGLSPAGGLSGRDLTWAKTFYPPLEPKKDTVLEPFKSVPLRLADGEQRNFVIEPAATRYYQIATFGISDTVIVLFEDQAGELRYRAGDDDSGTDFNAFLRVRLTKGRRYVLRVRLYYADRPGETAVMLW